MPNERFKNTDEDAAGKSWEFLKWSFTNKKPELVAIDSSVERAKSSQPIISFGLGMQRILLTKMG